MILMKKLVFIFLFLMLTCAYAIDTKELSKKANELYLINPLDSNEQVTIMSYSKVSCDGIYWVLPVSYNNVSSDDYIFLDDAKSDEFVSDNKSKELIITVNFSTSLGDLYYNSQASYYFDVLAKNSDDFSYSLGLIKSATTDSDMLKQIDYMQEDLEELKQNAENIELSIDNISENLLENKNNCKTKNEIVKKSEDLSESLELLDSDLQDIFKNLDWMKNKLTDLNIDYQKKVYINEQMTLPDTFTTFSEQKNYLDLSKDAIAKSAAKDKDFAVQLLVDSWSLRKDRAKFLKNYLSEDKDIANKTKKTNPKDLYEYVIVNKNLWNNQTKYTSFKKAYDEMMLFLEKNDYINANSKIESLNKISIEIISGGFKEVIVTEEEEDYSIYIYAGIAILLIILIPKIIKMIKKSIKKDDAEPEINIDLPN